MKSCKIFTQSDNKTMGVAVFGEFKDLSGLTDGI